MERLKHLKHLVLVQRVYKNKNKTKLDVFSYHDFLKCYGIPPFYADVFVNIICTVELWASVQGCIFKVAHT